jgi:uncharacterized protein (DUF433 family)
MTMENDLARALSALNSGDIFGPGGLQFRKSFTIEAVETGAYSLEMIGTIHMENLVDGKTVAMDAAYLSGSPRFVGTRIPVSAFLEHIALGSSVDEFLEWFPGVTREQLEWVLSRTEMVTA